MLRSRIVLESADGQAIAEVARRLGITADTVRVWRGRFLECRQVGLLPGLALCERRSDAHLHHFGPYGFRLVDDVVASRCSGLMVSTRPGQSGQYTRNPLAPRKGVIQRRPADPEETPMSPCRRMTAGLSPPTGDSDICRTYRLGLEWKEARTADSCLTAPQPLMLPTIFSQSKRWSADEQPRDGRHRLEASGPQPVAGSGIPRLHRRRRGLLAEVGGWTLVAVVLAVPAVPALRRMNPRHALIQGWGRVVSRLLRLLVRWGGWGRPGPARRCGAFG
ncbi:helix-turn-helix domain-containing protein [Streptomyces sp. AK02-04a]|uniref:helix-turn-helix domain-containing protein n=1 Tax=Streptomyces sp. AK02-04a TaxID=3028649 RepID=UPI0029A80D52|nr:helix-turn-helix domain-containing protein [Streptomyces sp. AK02-04a]MDX3761981.1 helix-turn-helix domain-containing protein [Streptomyces sp. AK02-04a]